MSNKASSVVWAHLLAAFKITQNKTTEKCRTRKRKMGAGKKYVGCFIVFFKGNWVGWLNCFSIPAHKNEIGK